MTDYEKHANERLGFITGLVSRGVDPSLAEFCAKQAEYESIGLMSPSDYIDGFAEKLVKMAELNKQAKQNRITIITDDDGDDDYDITGDPTSNLASSKPVVDAADEDDESIWDKIKRWATYAGIGAGGFMLGNYWPELSDYGKRSWDGIKSYYRDLTSKPGTNS